MGPATVSVPDAWGRRCDVRLGGPVGMGRDRGALAARDHCHRLDRVELLLHRARPGPAP